MRPHINPPRIFAQGGTGGPLKAPGFYKEEENAMKSRLLSIVAILALVGTALTFAGETKGETQTGTLIAFSGNSLTIATVDAKGKAKDFTFTLDAATVVKRGDQDMDWLAAARKGLKAVVTYAGKKALSVQLPFYGLETQGYPVPTETPSVVGVKDVRVNKTDSSNAKASEVKDDKGRIKSKVELVELEPETDDAWALADSKTIMLGNIFVLPDSVKLTVKGVELKVLPSTDGKGSFAEPAGSSALLDLTKGVYTLKFDQELGADREAAEKIVQLSFKKKMFRETSTEITYLPVDEAACIEVNGTRASLAEAMNEANYWLVRCNPEGAIIHIDAYFNAMPAVLKSASAKKLSLAFGKKTVTLAMSPGVTITQASGAPATVKDLKAGASVIISTEPAEAYNIVLVSLK